MPEALIEALKSMLASWSATGELTKAIQYTLSGGESLPDELTSSIESWKAHQFTDLPDIIIADQKQLNGYLGAFAPANKAIYLSSTLNDAPSTANVVLLHEFGHYLVTKYFEKTYVEHSTLNRFVGDLKPEAYAIFDAINLAGSKGAKVVELPNGETLSIETFDTAIHNSLDSRLFAGFSDSAKDYLALGQNHCDDPAPSNRFGLQYRSAAHFDNNNISGGLEMVRNWYDDALSNFNATNIQERKWNYAQSKSESFVDSISKGINNFLKTSAETGIAKAIANAANNVTTAVTNGLAAALPDSNDPNFISGEINPGFSGPNAGLELLLYRFGQINHAS